MTQIVDPVPNDTPGAREIQFSVPQHYNASAILFDNLAAGRGGKVAVVTERESLTYAEICAQACRIGNGLLDLGLTRGDRLVLVLNDSPDYIAAIFGALRAGLVATALMFFFGIYLLTRPVGHTPPRDADAETLSRAARLCGEAQDPQCWLGQTGDKRFLFSESITSGSLP